MEDDSHTPSTSQHELYDCGHQIPKCDTCNEGFQKKWIANDVVNPTLYPTYVQKVMKRRKSVPVQYKPGALVIQTAACSPTYSASIAISSLCAEGKQPRCSTECYRKQKRKITTIYEEKISYIEKKHKQQLKKIRQLKKKFESLRVVINRVKKLNNKTDNTLECNFPEEAITMFQKIHL